MPPQITCPHCGSTINLENRKEVDFEKIIYALDKSPKTFTELLMMTNLPRKTLSLRLKELCTSGSIIKDGGYHLNSMIKPTSRILKKRNGNGKMNGTMLHFGKNVQWIPAALIVCLVLVAFGSAAMLSPPSPSPEAPSAVFFYSPSSNIIAGSALLFDAGISTDTDGHITSYSWDFGDGTTASGVTTNHVYAIPGWYTVTLTVRDDQGLFSTKRETLNVAPQSQTKMIKFTISPDPTRGWENKWMVGKPLTFDASEFNSANGYASSYVWNFGDGSTGTDAVMSHIYSQAGTYNVELIAMELKGSVHVISEEVTIMEVPATIIYVDPLPSQYNVGDTITLNIKVTDVSNLFAWQTGMTFNPDVLECSTITYTFNGSSVQSAFTEGEFLKRGGTTMGFIGTVNDGVITPHGFSLYGDNAVLVSGSGILATVTFKVVGEGAFNIHLTDVKLTNFEQSGNPVEIPVYVAT